MWRERAPRALDGARVVFTTGRTPSGIQSGPRRLFRREMSAAREFRTRLEYLTHEYRSPALPLPLKVRPSTRNAVGLGPPHFREKSMSEIRTKSIRIGGEDLVIETGRMARLTNGSVTVRYGETIVLCTATASPKADHSKGWFPLFVEYREAMYSAGKIPGGFFRREGRPGEKEVLSARLIDRPCRPMFPDGFMHETQLSCNVISYDGTYDPDVLGIVGCGAALSLSGIPFDGPVAGVRGHGRRRVRHQPVVRGARSKRARPRDRRHRGFRGDGRGRGRRGFRATADGRYGSRPEGDRGDLRGRGGYGSRGRQAADGMAAADRGLGARAARS